MVESSPAKRACITPSAYEPLDTTITQGAMANSLKDTRSDFSYTLTEVPFGPTFYPTVEEMEGDPLIYLEKIRDQAEKYGICKIVPPKGWNPPFALNINCPKRFQTKDQSIHRLQEGISFGDGKEYTVKEYQEMATRWSKEWRSRRYGNIKPDSASSSTPDSTDVNIFPPSNAMSNTDIYSAVATNLASVTNSTNDTTIFQESVNKESKPQIMTPAALEENYWDIVEGQHQEIDVDYGNDVDTTEIGSGFPISERGRSVNSSDFLVTDSEEELPEPKFGTEQYYKETYWNLNNIPNSKNSVLRYVKVGINGINVPWLYFGCLFSTFCWHNEDNHMYSINYHHRGAPKQWYGVPGTKYDADGVERVFKNYLSMKLRDAPDLIHHITTFFSPRLLNEGGVKACKLLQNEGEFIVTFPRAFHGGYSLGPNCGEAVNFALHDWIPHAVDANERYRTFGRPSVLSHDRLVYTIAYHIEELRSKEICNAVSMELRRLMGEELLLRTKLIRSGVRDVSKDVELPPNRLDQLDEESADYDDKRLCHSCKHICFFSAVVCECSESKVSCLRHSHYMCRCSVKRKYLLIWTTEQEMKETISRVEKRCENVEYANPSTALNDPVQPKHDSNEPLVDAEGAEKDRLHHVSYEVPVDPICTFEPEVPSLISSDASCSSVGSRDAPYFKEEVQLQKQQLDTISSTTQEVKVHTSSSNELRKDVLVSSDPIQSDIECSNHSAVEQRTNEPSMDSELRNDALAASDLRQTITPSNTHKTMEEATNDASQNTSQMNIVFKASDIGSNVKVGTDTIDEASDDYSA